jgi:peptidoglycan biosynthesis protein MviN/MurJ (putative lipid II flippase)
MYTIISRWYYAQKDTRTPLFVSLFTIALNVFLAVTLSRPSTYGVVGLALAQSIVAMVEVFILFTIMVLRDHKLLDMDFFGGLGRIVSVTGFTVVAGSTMAALFPLGVNDRGITTLGTKLFFIALIVGAVHVGISALFGLEEVEPLFRRIKQLVLKPISIQY